jgi:hypothetical protein
MIKKNTILITSIGRTGTEFFAKFFSDVLPGCTSLHEPDILNNPFLHNNNKDYVQQFKYAGIRRLVFLKLLRQWTMVLLSDDRLRGKLDDASAVKQLHQQRSDFIAGLPGSVYVESNLGYYGLLDLSPRVFEHHKAVYIVRDGREWVTSRLNWGEAYVKKGLRGYFSHSWPVANQIPGDDFSGEWSKFSDFEQLCWAWSRLNVFALNTIEKNPDARVYKFENIFRGNARYDTLDDLVSFVTALPGIDPSGVKSTSGWLEQKIHQSANKFPGWDGWTESQKKFFELTCGPVMDRLGYTF